MINRASQPLLTTYPEQNWLLRGYHAVKYNNYLCITTAIIMSFLKLIQTSGQNIYGLEKTFASYNINNPNTAVIIIILTINNLMINGATRLHPLFNYFLPPKLHWLNDKNELSNSMRGYVLFKKQDNSILYKVIGPYSLQQFSLNRIGENALDQLRQQLQEQECHQQGFILGTDQASLFIQMKNNRLGIQAYRSLAVRLLHYFVARLCYLSVFFSGMTAYLSAHTLFDNIYGHFNETTLTILCSIVTLGSFFSYINFNLPIMLDGNHAFCQSVALYLETGSAGIPVSAMSITLPAVFFGVLAGVGMSYLTTTGSIHLFPLTRYLPTCLQEAVVLIGLFSGLCNNIFGFAFKTFRLFELYFPETTKMPRIVSSTEPTLENCWFLACNKPQFYVSVADSEAEQNITYFVNKKAKNPDEVCVIVLDSNHTPPKEQAYPLYAMLSIGADALSNSLGGFIGAMRLLTKILGKEANPITAQIALGSTTSLLALFEYILHREKNGEHKYSHKRWVIVGIWLATLGALYFLFDGTNQHVINKLIIAIGVATLIDNFFLNYSFAITGSEKAIAWVDRKLHRCSSRFFHQPDENRDTSSSSFIREESWQDLLQ